MALERLSLARQVLREASNHVGLAPQPPTAPREDRLPTGIERLDEALGGGLPRGRVAELTGVRSSGRMALTLRLLTEALRGGEPVALVDVADALDPGDLHPAVRDRVLWVRPRSVLDGLRCADLLLDAGGFAMVALYLVGVTCRGAGVTAVPASAWVRLGQRAEASRAVLLAVGDGAPAMSPGSFAAVSLRVARRGVSWRGGRNLLDDARCEVRVARARGAAPRGVAALGGGAGGGGAGGAAPGGGVLRVVR